MVGSNLSPGDVYIQDKRKTPKLHLTPTEGGQGFLLTLSPKLFSRSLPQHHNTSSDWRPVRIREILADQTGKSALRAWHGSGRNIPGHLCSKNH